MNLPFRIARRYLFSKKTTNAINIISGISIFGLSIGTAALILVLSVFNGFEDLITGMFSNFNPDLKVQPKEGKFFRVTPNQIAQIKQLPSVTEVSQTLEEIALFEYNGIQDFGQLKGVDAAFKSVTRIDTTIVEGKYQLQNGEQEMAVAGAGLRNNLSINVDAPFSSLTVYMPKNKSKGTMSDLFRRKNIYPSGTFNIQQDINNSYILSSLAFAQDIMGFKNNEISYLEIKLQTNTDEASAVTGITNILKDEVIIKNRYQQDEAFLKLMNIEKWMSFAILSLTLFLVAFNLIGALWMIVLEKKQDIAILQSMGATKQLIQNIFLSEGLLLCLLGVTIGFALALLLYGIQKMYGIVPVPEGFVISSYPASIRFFDFVAVGCTVLAIGMLAAIPPALRAKRISAIVRED